MINQSETTQHKQDKSSRFNSFEAAETMLAMENFVDQQKIASTAEISEQFRLSNTQTCAYLRELRNDGRIRAVGTHTRKTRSRCWEIGEDPQYLAAEAVPKKQGVVKDWAPHNRRDPLVYALFGLRGIAGSVLAAAGVPV